MDGQDKRQIGQYRLEQRLNENDAFQAWKAVDREIGARVFLKILPASVLENNKPAVDVIKSSFRLQSRLKSSLLLLARKYRKSQNNLIVEYPYLSNRAWETLDPKSLIGNLRRLLPEICLALDFIHTKNLVHGDIKLSNFMRTSESDSNGILKLTDLDFLSQSGKPTEALIFGTPDHIPPEIVENRIVENRSDNYSLGQALRKAVDSEGGLDSDYLGRLDSFIEGLVTDEIQDRPENLGNFLFESNLIDKGELLRYNRRLLAMQLIASFHEYKGALYNNSLPVKEFFVDKNNVWNIPSELYYDLERLPRHKALKAFEALLGNASIEKFGEYWRVDLTREQLREFYSSFDYEKDLKLFPLPEENEACSEYMGRLESYLEEIESERTILKHYLQFTLPRGAKSEEGEISNSGIAESGLKFVRAGLCESLGDHQEALDHYRNIYETANKGSCFREDALYKLAFRKLVGRKLDEAFELTDRYETEIESNEKTSFKLKRLRTYLMLERGYLDEALDSFQCLSNSAAENNRTGDLIRILGDLSGVYNRRGDRKRSIKYEREALRLAEENNLLKPYVLMASNLSVNYNSLAMYDKSIMYAKKAINRSEQTGNGIKQPVVFSNLIFSMIRQGDFHKARYWLNQFRLSGSQTSSHATFAHYYLFEGQLLQAQGKLGEAETTLKKAESILETHHDITNLIPVYHNRALIYLYRGDYETCREYFDKAYTLADNLKLPASMAELETIFILNEFYKYGHLDNEKTIDVIERLAILHIPYYLSLFLIHLIINERKVELNHIPHIDTCIKQIKGDKGTPLFLAISQFLSFNKGKIEFKSLNVPRLKFALEQMDHAGYLHLKALICNKLGKLYARDGYDKLSRKFWKHGRNVAAALKNESLLTQFENAILNKQTVSTDRSETIQVVLRISEIFKNIDDYEESVSNLVEFAVKETGAERGVLLLYPHEQMPRIEAYYNIDNESLKDVLDFSMNIPKKSIADLRPLIIEDASSNKFTESYKSIFRHNIRSVISIPLQITDSLKGALYLDHHSIPALFDEGDISFALSMANFISVLLYSLRNYRKIRVERNNYSEEFRSSGAHNEFITEDAKARDMLRMIPRIALSNANILILGESGTGKEIISEMIHRNSGRKDGPLIKLNCAAVSSSLMESELFGIDKETATSVSQKEGKIMAADGGTLLIDEIGDMPLEMQAKILRAIENHEFYKVGSNRLAKVDVRFVYATNKDLEKLVKQDKFREDLYYRINTITIKVPALRKRSGDIPLLLKHFIELFSQNYSAPPSFTDEAMEALKFYQWPGNVRELKNLAEKYAILYHGKRVTINELPEEIKLGISQHPGKLNTDNDLKARITELLIKYDWNQSKVARIMGMSLSTLRRRIEKFDIEKP